MGQLNKSSTFFTSLFLLTVAVALSPKGFIDTSIAFKFFADEVFWSLRRLSVVGLIVVVVVTGSIKIKIKI